MELNREQIIKALECCIKNQCENCCQCGDWHEQWNCMTFLMKNALALIKELTEENEWLEENLIKQCTENIMLLIELKEIKEDTVRNMQERLCEEILKVARCQLENEPNITSQEVFKVVRKVAKEMEEG